MAQAARILTLLLCSLIGFSAANAQAYISMSHDYKQVQAYLKQIHARYPHDTALFSIGTSGTGDSIDGISIGSGEVHNLIVGTHHGNEYGATEVAIGAIADLAAKPITGETVFVIPVLNVSGFNVVRREESVRGTDEYKTADPNRDYPGPCGTEGPFHLKSTKALADFIDRENIVASATLHTFYPVVAYPWGFDTPDLATPYDQQFIDLAKIAAKYSQYDVGNSSTAIYPAQGAFEDYAFWKHGIWSLLFELGDTHSPDEDQLKQLVAVNVPGLRDMMEKAPRMRAADHAFHGRCDSRHKFLDRHDE